MDEGNSANITENVNNVVNVKTEQLPNGNDDNEVTPVREENLSLNEPAIYGTGGAGWESDSNEYNGIVTPPPPSLSLDAVVKQSPSNDNDVTPLRKESQADEPNPDNTEAEAEPLKVELPDEFLDSLEAEAVPTLPVEIVKKEERKPLDLDFLNEVTEEDFACMDQDNLEVPPTEPPAPADLQLSTEHQPCNEYTEEELSQRMDDVRSQLKKLDKKGKKHKKAKKRDSHKKRRRSRSRSRTRSPHCSRKKRHVDDAHSSSASMTNGKRDSSNLDYIQVQNCEKTLKIISVNSLLEKSPAEKAPAALPALTIKDKRRLAVERAKSVLSLLRLQAAKAPATEFLVVDTFIKKLPSRASYESNEIFESPSPLCNNFNVKYKFNSTTGCNIDVAKWGLQRFPMETTQLMRITGIDAARLTELMQNSKMALPKLRSQRAANKQEEDEFANNTGLYKSVATQTTGRICDRSRDVAVQAKLPSKHDVFWNQPGFNESNLTRMQANCMMALKELCSREPSSHPGSVDKLYQALLLAIDADNVSLFQYNFNHCS